MTPSLGYLLAVLAIVFLIDLGLRGIPFILLEPLRESRFVRTMGAWMPAGILFVLAAVTLHSHAAAVTGKGWAALLASAITIAVHLLGGRRMMLSIAAGTVSYVALLAFA
ncbi:MAG: AzlD domain-containing protein [Schaalia hyovaginalis]|uniref:branched-chain amino acid transporter permease n=1 Tax=Schaalia hyovaginalis TaxID=29316 RepID=UPI0012B38C44|nr:AzlD domain-containing protein [Schaalia hyovaginalis]MCI6410548.1 AzlD domain-containing protein [Schaalia hyovaginalis]MCI6556644.1 AzlD domain-containing protein [Schaalia hyovaginalis]MCI7513528.1 AzlD domain-containing protein [Schaalia hyovaginalis]MDD7553227.1 AzlD domain-containing protein [Schaalia hyovaginalis]MDY3093896.1 AzlD domain-containing protein [Schaalia hyovaginalis]